MNVERIDLGPTPAEEPCSQVGDDNYDERARLECKAYIDLLTRTFVKNFDRGPSCKFKVASRSHDFGTYHEVEAVARDEDELIDALWLEANCPTCWDDEARSKLKKNG